jgi:hypothetical protein
VLKASLCGISGLAALMRCISSLVRGQGYLFYTNNNKHVEKYLCAPCFPNTDNEINWVYIYIKHFHRQNSEGSQEA